MGTDPSAQARRHPGLVVGLVLLLAVGFPLLGGHTAAHAPADPPAPSAATPAVAGPAPSAGPYLAYGNATILLPGWNSLAAYAWNCNTNVSVSTGDDCFSTPHLGYGGTQVPLLSWTASGAFYVNASLDLVFYSFVTGAVTRIAAWLPLYENTMYYTGETNTEYITADGSYIYEFGCLSESCRSSSAVPITSYVVNVTTGRTFEHTWSDGILSGPSSGEYSTYYNAQSNLVGVDGNDSILTLTVTWAAGGDNVRNGTTWAYDLWTGVEWKLADLPFFEANNLYWLPEFSQFFDVSADGTTYDAVVQGLLAGPPSHPALTLTHTFVYSPGEYAIGGVDGLWVDVLTHEVAFQVDWQGSGEILSIVAQLGPDGAIAGFSSVAGPDRSGNIPSVLAGEHRETIVTGPPSFSPPQEGNPDAWLSDPLGTSTYLPTNVSQSMTAWNVDGSLFYNTSYSILTGSDQCERVSRNGTACPILGTSGAGPAGTIWWTWKLGLPEFPFPSGAPLAEPLGPLAVAVGATATSTGMELRWTVPSDEPDPILNFSVAWGPAPGEATNWASLPANATEYALTGLGSGEAVYFEVDAWNLHGPTPTYGNLTLGKEALPAAPVLNATFAYDPSVAVPGAANLTIRLTEGSSGNGSLVNDTLFWGTSPGTWTHTLSGKGLGLPVGSGRVVWTIADLPAGATYYFVGSSWNSWGEGPPSGIVTLVVPTEAKPPAPPAGGATASLVQVVEVGSATVAVVVGGAVYVILQGRRERRRPPRA